MSFEPTGLGLERIDPDAEQWRDGYLAINQHAEKVTELVTSDRARIAVLETAEAEADADTLDRAYGTGRMTVGAARVDPGVDVRYAAFPNQTKLSDGRILMVWYEATDHISTRDGIVVGSYSEDNGLTWGPKITFVSYPGLDLRDPTVSTSADGSILYLTWIRCTAAKPRDGFFVRRSFDNGETWGPDIRIDPEGSNGAGTAPLVELASGVLLAVWFGTLTGESTDSCWRAYSPDNGVTWSVPERFLNGPADARYYGEPYAAVHGDNVVIMYRHGEIDQLGITRSTNSGATWSVPAPLWLGTGRPSCTITSAGTLLVVFRDRGASTAYQHAVMRTSADYGLTWTQYRMVERADPSWMLYSCPTEIAPGVVMVSTSIEQSGTAASISVRYLVEGGGVSPLGDVAPPAEARAVDRLNTLGVVDSFDRADAPAGSVGWSDNGQRWVSTVPGPGILDGALYWSGTGGPYLVTARAGDPDMEVEAEVMYSSSTGIYLLSRYNAATDYLMAGIESAGVSLYKVVAGVTTKLGTTVAVPTVSGSWHKLKLTSIGTTHRVYFEDDLIITQTDSAHSTREWAGVRMGVASTLATHRVRNFVARRRGGRAA